MPRVFRPVTRTIEASIQGVMDGQLVENKVYAQAAAAVTAAMVEEIANIVETWVSTSLLPHISADYTHTRTVARDISTASSFEFIDASHAGAVGADVSGGLPNNATIAVHRDTGMGGVKAKSRIYQVGLPLDALLTPNTLTAAAKALYITAWNALRTAILAGATSTFLYGYPQRVVGGAPLATGNFITVLSHSFTDAVVDSMRARLPGHGL